MASSPSVFRSFKTLSSSASSIILVIVSVCNVSVCSVGSHDQGGKEQNQILVMSIAKDLVFWSSPFAVSYLFGQCDTKVKTLNIPWHFCET